MSINERILDIIHHYNLNKNSFSVKIGLTNSVVIGNIVGGRKSKPSYAILKKILETFPIDANWLLSGKGPMFLDPAAETVPGKDINIAGDTEGKAAFEQILDQLSVDEIITYIHEHEHSRGFDKNTIYKMFLKIRAQRKIIEELETAGNKKTSLKPTEKTGTE